ncbi:MAG: N-acetylmuramoyl-L-alanine amidase [Gammaproteobacteria bacterium]|nr:N-acetylmuramoyl-L-alanine amidase [Pseudomonadales bacterium]
MIKLRPILTRILMTLMLFGAAVPLRPVAAATVEQLRVSPTADHTRLALDLSGSIDYNIFSLDNPQRLVIDIPDSRLTADLSQLELGSGPIRSIRTGIRNGNDLRVVLDLDQALQYESFTLTANGEFRDRLIVDLHHPVAQTSVVRTVKTLPVVQPEEKRDILVAVVAGHGGDDPGAPSYDRKFWEKDITLAIARAVEERLRQTPGYHPLMIRDGDYSVALKSRPVIARDKRVDVYISIHADSYRGREVQGVTVYALSGETADQENTRRVEEKENMADLLGGVAGDTRIADVEDDLALTLLDLSMAWSMEQSVTLGTHILDTLDGVAPLRKDKVQGGNLWELRSPDIPSILIETGYLSNPAEAERLRSANYQRRLADAIVQGVKNYFYASPPEGTLVAWQLENGVAPESYTVKRGDSLSEIAVRFGVSLAELKTANALRGDVIQVGQTLTIPGSAAMPRLSEHRIARGETLSEIAERYRISLSSLRRANNLVGDKIMIGQVLKIPTS